MANVVRDPKQHPEVVIPDFTKPDPLLTFKLDDVAFVYGTKWKQRYFTKVGDDYFPLPAQWDVTHKLWRAYMVQPNTDWWVPFYPADNMKRPTGPLCDGCHSVNYDVRPRRSRSGTSGASGATVRAASTFEQPGAATIVNPARLDFVRANDTCIQCHSQGQPLKNPIEGQYYDWPVGFHQGATSRTSGSSRSTSSARRRSRTFRRHGAQEPDAGQRLRAEPHVYAGRHLLQLPRRPRHGEQRRSDQAGQAAVPDVSRPSSPNGPHAASIEDHTHHQRGSAGSECVACHMPKIEQTIADVNVRSHTFKFITPAMTDQFKIPNAVHGLPHRPIE